MNLKRICFLFMFVAFFLTVRAADEAPAEINQAALCLSPGVDMLRFLGYSKKARLIEYSYAKGGVPNSSMVTDPFTSILFRSPSGRRALLVFVLSLPDGRMVAMEDGYLMRLTSDGWEASEGNGGIGMYERVQKFVEQLTKEPVYRISTTDPVPTMCVDEDVWEKEKSK